MISLSLQMVQLLVSRGANVNAFDKKDRRAVHWAAYMGETSTSTSGSTENMFPSASDQCRADGSLNSFTVSVCRRSFGGDEVSGVSRR